MFVSKKFYRFYLVTTTNEVPRSKTDCDLVAISLLNGCPPQRRYPIPQKSSNAMIEMFATFGESNRPSALHDQLDNWKYLIVFS